MCQLTTSRSKSDANDDKPARDGPQSSSSSSSSSPTNDVSLQASSNALKTQPNEVKRVRRGKRDKEGQYVVVPTKPSKKKAKKKSKAFERHGKDSPSGGLESMIPSLIGLAVLVGAVMAQRGFRGRASVAGIDLGTTNSVICVQAPSKSVGTIECIVDPTTGSPIIPSVVAFLEPWERPVGPSSKIPSLLVPHPSAVVVGQAAKQRIESHPRHTLYNAKRVLGRPPSDPAVSDLRHEVEFHIVEDTKSTLEVEQQQQQQQQQREVAFQVDDLMIPPQQVGSYIVHHLMQITKAYLGHENIKSAVLAVPAKFDNLQRQRTMEAFKQAGIKVARVLEEPTAAALAYGLHKKEGVEKILVYDFGGGTLDISILHVSEGYCEVMASDGDDRLGGADFDAAVAHLLADRHSDILQRLADSRVDPEALASKCGSVISPSRPLCSVSSLHTIGEQLKISLSQTGKTATAECLRLPSDSDVVQPNQLEKLCDQLVPQSLVLTLEDYDLAAKPLYERSVLPVQRLLEDLTLDEKDIDEIVMVGGTTRMPQIRALVRDVFSEAQLNTHIDPDITVAYGAASVND